MRMVTIVGVIGRASPANIFRTLNGFVVSIQYKDEAMRFVIVASMV